MPTSTVITSVSLPPRLRKRLDQEAKRQRRARSFVVAEAIEEYLGRRERQAFTEGRERTLREGLALSPAERLALSEGLWLELTRGRGSAPPWTAAFDTFDDYERWRRQGGARAG
jgi:predicted transcriptional regulator